MKTFFSGSTLLKASLPLLEKLFPKKTTGNVQKTLGIPKREVFKMKKTAIGIILGACFLNGGFAEDLSLKSEGIDFQRSDPGFKRSSYQDEEDWNKYISVSISGLAYRYAVVEFGHWSKQGENSFLIALKQALSKKAYSISPEIFYQRHFNPLDLFQFYSGIGLEGGLHFPKEKQSVLFFTPMLSLGKIINASKENTQFLEIRTNLGHYFQSLAYPEQHVTVGYKPNYEIYFGVSF